RDTRWSTTADTPATRRLRYGDALVAEVHYADRDPWNGTLWIVNFRDGYSLQVASRSGTAEDAPP
ncbi:MAG: DUF3261 domain-containing protein, partial [Panacagrimonas sp.]